MEDLRPISLHLILLFFFFLKIYCPWPERREWEAAAKCFARAFLGVLFTSISHAFYALLSSLAFERRWSDQQKGTATFSLLENSESLPHHPTSDFIISSIRPYDPPYFLFRNSSLALLSFAVPPRNISLFGSSFSPFSCILMQRLEWAERRTSAKVCKF